MKIAWFLVNAGPHCNENPIYVFLFWELRSLSPNFHIHTFMCLWAIYIFPGLVHIFPAAEEADRSWEYVNHSQAHECVNWDCGRSIPFLGIFVSNFLVLCSAPRANTLGEKWLSGGERVAWWDAIENCLSPQSRHASYLTSVQGTGVRCAILTPALSVISEIHPL